VLRAVAGLAAVAEPCKARMFRSVGAPPPSAPPTTRPTTTGHHTTGSKPPNEPSPRSAGNGPPASQPSGCCWSPACAKAWPSDFQLDLDWLIEAAWTYVGDSVWEPADGVSPSVRDPVQDEAGRRPEGAPVRPSFARHAGTVLRTHRPCGASGVTGDVRAPTVRING